MAKLINGHISGKLGDRIYYQRNGKSYVRSMPFNKRSVLKVENLEFGKASRIARAIRNLLLPAIPNPTDKSMHQRLLSAVLQWLRSKNLCESLTLLNGFEFSNRTEPFRAICRVPIRMAIPAKDYVQINIPSFDPIKAIEAPGYTGHVIFRIAMGVCDITTGSLVWCTAFSRLFPYNTTKLAEERLTMNMPTSDGNLVLAAASVEFVPAKRTVVNKSQSLISAGIIDTIYI